jgi:surface polysaccharide O-acyltransferase-like enzyme
MKYVPLCRFFFIVWLYNLQGLNLETRAKWDDKVKSCAKCNLCALWGVLNIFSNVSCFFISHYRSVTVHNNHVYLVFVPFSTFVSFHHTITSFDLAYLSRIHLKTLSRLCVCG